MPARKTERAYCFDLEIASNFFSVTFARVCAGAKDAVGGAWSFVIHESRDDRAMLFRFMQRVDLLVGYNSIFFDSALLRSLLMGYEDGGFREDACEPQEATARLFALSQKLINGGDGSEEDDRLLRSLRFPYPKDRWNWKQIDLLKLMAFDKLGIGLKQVAINLHFPRIQDLPFDYRQEIRAEDIGMVLEYNLNDVRITERLYHALEEQIALRQQIGSLYKVDVQSASDSKIANVILEHAITSDRDELKRIRDLRTRRAEVRIADCIPDSVQFQTDSMQRVLQSLSSGVLKDYQGYAYRVRLAFEGKRYELGIGGLHSHDQAGVFESKDGWIISDADVSSYYPSIILNQGIRPQHLGDKFSEVFRQMTEDRLRAKHQGDKLRANVLKITINSIFGKLNSPTFWLQDAQAFLSVTIAGQLYLLMLIEMLAEKGIETISANTDGIVCRYREEEQCLYETVCSAWSSLTGFELEFNQYRRYIRRDVNNYLAITDTGKTKSKGVFAKVVDLRKGMRMPIIQQCLENYFVEGVPVEDTLTKADDIYAFATSQKTGAQFVTEYHTPDGQIASLQKSNRFYIAETGGALVKRNRATEATTRLYKGESVRLLNQVNGETPFEDYQVKRAFYQKEAEKIIHIIQPRVVQTALF